MNANPFRMLMTLRFRLFLSIGLGSILGAIGTYLPFYALMLDLIDAESRLAQVLLWNMNLGNYLAAKGILPACFGCDNIGIIYPLFDAFFVGAIGYSIVLCIPVCIFHYAHRKEGEDH